MPIYCSKTTDIPANELTQWQDIGYSLESNDLRKDIAKPAWVNH